MSRPVVRCVRGVYTITQHSSRTCLWCDVLHPDSKQQTTPASPRDALECVAALARTRECRQDCVRFAYRGPQVDRLHVLELKRDVE